MSVFLSLLWIVATWGVGIYFLGIWALLAVPAFNFVTMYTSLLLYPDWLHSRIAKNFYLNIKHP